MGARLLSGFYLSKKSCALLGALLGALLLALLVLGSLYGRCARRLEEQDPRPVAPSEPPTAPSPAPTPGRPPGPWDEPRLPADLTPLHYSLLLWPPLAPGLPAPRAHWGQANITLRCRRATARVLLHSAALAYRSASVWGPLGRVPLAELWLAPLHQYAVLQLRANLSAGALYQLRLTFQGLLSAEPHFDGLFLSAYEDEGESRTLIATHLKPIGARRVYPCFDEPAMKATFNISIIHHPSYVVLSNMPAVDTSEYKDLNESTLGILRNWTMLKNWTVTTFGTTPKMSTYNTAFVICNFDYVSTTERGKEIRIWAKKDAIRNGFVDYALNITGPFFPYMEDLFNISYPLPKADLIALPGLRQSSMENWGLITTEERDLLYRPQDKFTLQKLLIHEFVPKKIAQQWFGNLVTMDWWNDIWLNDGFASYFAYLGLHHIIPEQQMIRTFNRDMIIYMLTLDGRMFLMSVTPRKNSQIIIRHPFAYLKEAAIVQMLSSFMTERLFIKALSSYLNAFSFSNVIQDDLWHHIQKIIDEQNELQLPAPVKVIMDSWTHLAGSPLLTLNVSTGNIKQELFDPSKDPSDTSNEWIIPISWMRNGSIQPLIWLDNRSKVFPEMKISVSIHDWILLNVNATGYYRVNYDQSNWRKLAKALERDPKMIPAINRLKLMHDAFELSGLGYTEYDTPLYLTKYLKKEDDIVVWGTVLHNLQQTSWGIIRHDCDTYGVLKEYFLPQISPIYHRYMDLLHQSLEAVAVDPHEIFSIDRVIGFACWVGLQDCLDLASEIFAKWMDNPDYECPFCISKHLFCYGVQTGSDKQWDLAWKMYNCTDCEDVKNTKHSLLFALSCTNKPYLLQRLLQYTFNKPSGTVLEVIRIMGRTDAGYQIAWKFLTDNWPSLYKRFGRDGIITLNHFMNFANTDLQFQMIELFLNNMLDTEQRIIATDKLKAAKSTHYQKKQSTARMIKWLQENIED